MAEYRIGAEHIPLLTKLQAFLSNEEPNLFKQQIAIELLTVTHAMRAGDKASMVLEGMYKHARQILASQQDA